MIYYYFGSKEQLFEAVLEQAYSEIRAAEQDVRLDHLDPLAAIRRLAEITFDHHDALPDFVSLVRIESIHQAEHIRRSAAIVSVNSPAIELITKILDQGEAEGFPPPAGCHWRAHDDQFVLRLPARSPSRLQCPVRPRPHGSGAVRPLPHNGRRHGGRLPDRTRYMNPGPPRQR
jgi:AcrR family transcriptional regulator